MRLIALLVLLASPAWGQAPHHVYIDSTFVRYLEQISETAHVETARCVLGEFSGDTVRMMAVAEMPWLIVGQTDTSVSWRWWFCPRNTVALWHSHLWRVAQKQDPAGRATCFLSAPDMGLLNRPEAPWFAMVSIKRGWTCLFVRLGGDSIGQVPLTR